MDSQAVYSNRSFPLRRKRTIRKKNLKLGSFRQPRNRASRTRNSLTEIDLQTERLLSKLIGGVRNCIDSLYTRNGQARVGEGLLTQIRGFSKITAPSSERIFFTSLENLLPIQESLSTSENNTMELVRSELLSNSLILKAEPQFLLGFYHQFEKLLSKRKLVLRREAFKTLLEATWGLCEKYVYDNIEFKNSTDYEVEWSIFEALDFNLCTHRKELWELQVRLANSQHNC